MGHPSQPPTDSGHRDESLRETIRATYARAALAAKSGATSGCGCSSGGEATSASCCSSDLATEASTGCGCSTPSTSRLGYDAADIGRLPREAVSASLGCGNPIALAELREGEDVLDLGSGGGIDVLLSARRVGPGGTAYGVDMTEEMLELARENQRKSGLENARFLRGSIEDVPLPEESVDVVISNCVINLSTDKHRTLGEAFRVLRPGGRLAVADIVTTRPMPPSVRQAAALWAGCVAGALTIDEYRRSLADAGFEAIEIEPVKGLDGSDHVAEGERTEAARELASWDGRVLSAFVRAVKPRAARVGRTAEGLATSS